MPLAPHRGRHSRTSSSSSSASGATGTPRTAAPSSPREAARDARSRTGPRALQRRPRRRSSPAVTPAAPLPLAHSAATQRPPFPDPPMPGDESRFSSARALPRLPFRHSDWPPGLTPPLLNTCRFVTGRHRVPVSRATVAIGQSLPPVPSFSRSPAPAPVAPPAPEGGNVKPPASRRTPARARPPPALTRTRGPLAPLRRRPRALCPSPLRRHRPPLGCRGRRREAELGEARRRWRRAAREERGGSGLALPLPSLPPPFPSPAPPSSPRAPGGAAAREPRAQHGGALGPRQQAQARRRRQLRGAAQQPRRAGGRPVGGPVAAGGLAVTALLHHPLPGLAGRLQLAPLRRHPLREHHPRVRPLVSAHGGGAGAGPGSAAPSGRGGGGRQGRKEGGKEGGSRASCAGLRPSPARLGRGGSDSAVRGRARVPTALIRNFACGAARREARGNERRLFHPKSRLAGLLPREGGRCFVLKSALRSSKPEIVAATTPLLQSVRSAVAVQKHNFLFSMCVWWFPPPSPPSLM